MKDIFNRRQRFSLRKYSVGVCSVLLGTALFVAGAPSASAEEVTATPESSTETAATETASSTEVATETTTTESSNYEAPAALVATSEPVTTASSEKAEATTETSKASEEEKKTEEASKEEKKTEDKKSEDKKSEDKKSEDKKSSTEAKTEKATTSAASEANTETTSSSEATETETTSLAANPAVQPLNASANKPVADSTATTSATTLSAASTETATAGALETSRSRRRGRRAATDHNTEPVTTASTLNPDTEATPGMTDPNGATVHSQTIPTGYEAVSGDKYTYGIIDLSRYNTRYNKNYYIRVSKDFDQNVSSVVELVDKTTNTVLETHTVTAGSGRQVFTKTAEGSKTANASGGELTLYVTYDAGKGKGPGRTDQPFLQWDWIVDPTIESYQHATGNTPADRAKKKLFTDVTDSRTITDIFNAVEPASNGRTITNTNRIIPAMVDNSTFYKVVDKNSAEYQANPNKSKADRENSAIQNYKETGNEESLATYTVTGMEGQDFTSSGIRHFKDYRLYQPADPNGTSGALSRRFKVGDKFMDADAYGIKRIKEVVKEDGSVVIRVYLLDPKQQSKRSNGTLDTDGYMLIAETEPIAPGQNNTKPLVTHMTPLNTIAFTGSDGVSHPNGIPVDFKFQDAAGYTPYKTVFVPFLGDGIGHWSANSQLVNGVKGIGTNVDLMNTLTPFTPAVYYYDKIPPIDVELKVTKALTDPTNSRTLRAGDFTFNIKNADSSTPAIDEDVTNKADGSVNFTKKVTQADGSEKEVPLITLDKEGVYKYIITEKAGADPEVDYDGMNVTATVTVKEKKDASGYLGEYEYTVTYTSTDGQDSTGQPNNSSAASNDTEFNNFVVAPVNVEFDFTKKLDGRKLQANEFTFNLLDESGAVIGTATNDAAGNVKFTGIKYTVNDLGTDASGKRNDSKTFNYTVKEVQGSLANVTYDQMEAKVTVTVTKPKTGHTLAAVSTISSTGGVDADGNSTTGTPDTEFNNKYTPSPVKVNLDFDKSLSNGTLNAGDFSFTLTANTAGDTNTDQRVTNKANGKINFSVLSFDKVGVYNYTVKEVKGNVADVDYDAMTIDVTVTVTKDADTGLLSATTAMTSSGGEATDANDRIFNNHVVAPVTAQFDFSKVLAGRQLTAGEFSFELVDPSDTSTDPNGKVLQTKTNDANGLVKFDALTFKNGQEGTHKYIVREVQGSLTGVTYDTMKAEVTVTVTKSGHALTAVTTLPTDTVFNNTYTPSPASAQFRFTKKLEGKTLQGDDFEFELLENGNVIQTKKNVADGSITFDAISYATEGVHTYTVREKAGNDTNIDYDAMNATVTVTVTKDATTGLLNAAVTLPTDTEFNNYVVPPVPVNVNFTKALAGRALVAGEFTFEMKDENGVVVATGTNDEHGVVTFNQLPEVTNAQVGKVIKYTVSEKVPANKEFGVTYDNMVAEVSVSVVKNATSHALQAVVTYPGGDTEFNNTVTPPTTPDFQPEKFIVNKEKYDITGTKLMDDDDELADEYTDTNANPYADGTANNEPENLNTKTVKKGDKIVYQVWLDTTNLKASDNIQAVGISDKYEADKLEINVADIKAYDSVTGVDVTDKFDITVNNGVITATSKASFIKDINNDPVIDTTLFEFGRYYKFDIPATVKMTTPNGVDIENTANQIVHQYDPTHRNITKPEKPTQKRVVNIPVPLEFDFTKKLDGRNLVENEFTFVLKKDGVAIQTVKNSAPDATTGIAKIAFKPLEFTKADAGNTFTYTVEEVAGTDATVSYDNMVATIKVEVKHDGTTKTTVVNMLQDAPDKEFNNTVKPPEEPKFNPEKYVVDKEKFDITGDKLVDDDKELADKYADTNANPYADDASNNEPENLNTKTVKPGDKLVYQVWLDTKQFSATNTENIQTLGITDNYDEDKLDVNSIKVYDSVTGTDVTSKFDIANTGGVITATLKAGFTKSLGDANNTQIIDTTKFAFGRYYKVDIVTTVKTSVEPGKDIENTAGQIVHYYNPRTNKVEKPEKPTEKRVNSVPVPLELKFTKALDGRALQAGEFEFILEKDGVEVERVKNDAAGKINFKKLEFGKNDLGKTYNYTVREVAGTDATVTYDTMVATVTVIVSHDGTAKAIVANVTDAPDKEFNNKVTPPETPEFNPEKYILNESKFDLTGTKLLDDDSELADKYGDTNVNPYADGTANNEAQNINTQTLKKGDKVYYQVWLDTTKFTEAQNIQSVGVTDKYDSENLDVNVADIKAYDGVTGADVTDQFDITVNNGVITATLKAGFTKSLGDANNTQVIDTTKFAFGRYYKFEIPAIIKATAKDGVDIENTATQIVHQYDPTSRTVKKPEKPTEKRVVNIPTKVEFEFTKRLEGRELKAGEFSFVLKDKDGNIIETVSNDAAGKIKFSALEYTRGQEGTYTYTVEEVQGTEAGVEYDKMVATVTVTVTKDGKVLTATSTLPVDTEFNNKVTPPTPPTPPTPTTPPAPALPETGEEQSASAVLLGAALGMVGLAGLAKRKKRED